LDLTRQLHSIVTALPPALAEIGQIGIEFAAPTARWGTFRENTSRHKAMHQLSANMQMLGNHAFAQSLSRQGDYVLIANDPIGTIGLPPPLGSRLRLQFRCP
jgi:hypothetical protein